MIFLSISEKNFIDNKKSLYYNTKSMSKGVHPFEESIPRRAERLFILPCAGNQGDNRRGQPSSHRRTEKSYRQQPLPQRKKEV